MTASQYLRDTASPTHAIPGVEQQLHQITIGAAKAGADEAITLVTALGTHRPMTAKEVARKVGAARATICPASLIACKVSGQEESRSGASSAAP